VSFVAASELASADLVGVAGSLFRRVRGHCYTCRLSSSRPGGTDSPPTPAHPLGGSAIDRLRARRHERIIDKPERLQSQAAPTAGDVGHGDRAEHSKDFMKTFSAKPAEVTHEWFVIDATDKVLGRVASEAARRLRGKHKAIYTPHVDTGDFIVVVNADKIRVTGNKAEDKVYYRHTGYPGGIVATKFKDMQARHPGRALEKAVKGMLPKGPLGYAMVKKLKVYAGATHRSRWRSDDDR
jgi:large subunit ribosomal protein L13